MKILIVIPIIVLVLFFSKNERKPSVLGATKGLLAPCPDSPNCVSSQANDASHYIDPIKYSGGEHPFIFLKRIISKFPKTQIIKENPDYLHVEFRSDFFSFVDDVEFLYDKESKIIHLRSASRTGYSDLGVNKKRLNKISEDFNRLTRESE